MSRRGSRIWIAACMTLSGAYLCAGGNLACGSFAADAAVSSADMCFIFDCNDGILGGVIDPCAQVTGRDSGSPPGGGEEGGSSTDPGRTGTPFFSDCPLE